MPTRRQTILGVASLATLSGCLEEFGNSGDGNGLEVLQVKEQPTANPGAGPDSDEPAFVPGAYVTVDAPDETADIRITLTLYQSGQAIETLTNTREVPGEWDQHTHAFEVDGYEFDDYEASARVV